jgi:hypothetical protein
VVLHRKQHFGLAQREIITLVGVDSYIMMHNPYVHCSPMSTKYLLFHFLRFYACALVAAYPPIRWLCRPPLFSFHSLCPLTWPHCGAD